MRATIFLLTATVALVAASASPARSEEAPQLPGGPLTFGAFVAWFGDEGAFTLEGEGWPALKGTWTTDGTELELNLSDAPEGCGGPGRYEFAVEGKRVSFQLLADECMPRRMILGGSTWRPVGEVDPIPERNVVLTSADARPKLPAAAEAGGSWPSFRGPMASGVADGQALPDRWDTGSGQNILWKLAIPGLAHSSPVVWGERVFVTSAISSRADATFRPGLYGDGDASDDRSVHRFVVYAVDKRSGNIEWQRVAYEGEPIDKRHIKSTYASATPATDGRIVVASFGSQGVYAYTVDGDLLWTVDVGRLDLGAYDVPTYEWGPASSPIIWNGRVFLQCDTQQDSFILALDLETGETLWQAERDEPPSWGTPTVVEASSGPELVTNGSNLIRGYDPREGTELWRLGGSSKITAPTPISADGVVVVASGRGPERPIFVLRPGSRGDLTLPAGETASDAVVWSIQRRGPYMPTPLIYQGRLFVLGNNGVLPPTTCTAGRRPTANACRIAAAASALRRLPPTASSTSPARTERSSSSPPGPSSSTSQPTRSGSH